MDVCLIISIEDNEGVSHNEKVFEFSNETTVKQLMEKINSIWQIDQDYQDLFYNGSKINKLYATLLQLGIKNEDKIVVKHSMFSVWEQLMLIVELVEEAPDYKKPGLAASAIKDRDRLLEAKFFICYSKFIPKVRELNKVVAHYEDLKAWRIEDSARHFFSVMYEKNAENPQLKVEFRPKPSSGMQGGMICDIRRGCDIITFFLKVYAARSSRSIAPVDICELFVYRLLYFIEIGPEVFFIPNVHQSCFGLYIATKAVDGFKKPKRSQVGFEQLALLDLLRSVFYLFDLHSDNFGLDKNDRLCIVDFQIGDISSGNEQAWKRYMSGDNNERRRIAKEVLKSFSLTTNIDRADSSLEETKHMLQQRDFACHWSKYAKYLEKVKSNVQFFENKLADV